MIRRPPRSTLFPTRRSSDLGFTGGTWWLLNPVTAPHAWWHFALCGVIGIATSDRKSTRLNSSHGYISYAVFCLKKKKKQCCIDTRRKDEQQHKCNIDDARHR